MKSIYIVAFLLGALLISMQDWSDKKETNFYRVKSQTIEEAIYLEEEPKEIEPQIQNILPKVNAGEDAVLVFGEKARLKATASDEDGEIVSYEWREGKKILSEKQSFSLSLPLGRHTVSVRVTDDHGASTKDEVIISVGKYYVIKENSYDTNTTEYNSYNSEGNITKRAVDENNDGIMDRVYTTKYNDEGKIIYESTDIGDDGIIDSEESYIYDDRGNLIENRYSYNIDDNNPLVYKYTYNDKNQKVSSTIEGGYREETENKTFLYNKEGKVTKVLIDNNDDEVIDKEEFHSYNSDSKITERTIKDMEGNIEGKMITRYHENGKQSFYSNDWSGSGDPDLIFEYDENGYMTNAQYHLQEDGTYKYHLTRNYTDSGKLKETKGNWFSREKITYTYDKNSDKVLYTKKYDKEGKEIDGKEYYHYDEHGNLIEIVNEEGEILSSWEYEFIIGEREL